MATRTTEEERVRIREMRDLGMSYRAIGLEVGRGRNTVARLCDPSRALSNSAYEQSSERKEGKNAYGRSGRRRRYVRGYSKLPRCKAAVKAYRQTVQGRLRINMRNRINSAIKCNQRAGSAVRDLGCTISELKTYLELLFQHGMTWDNWAIDGWHIDHIKPLASFDLTDREQFLQACHYTNLQPLWAENNLRKWCK